MGSLGLAVPLAGNKARTLQQRHGSKRREKGNFYYGDRFPESKLDNEPGQSDARTLLPTFISKGYAQAGFSNRSNL